MQITIDNKIISIDKYKQIKSLENDLILIDTLTIIGHALQIISLDPYRIVIKGEFNTLKLG